jgi:hypothetical protein
MTAGEVMDDFFAQTEGRWPAGREDYCWHALPGPGPLVGRLAGQYQELTHWPGLAPVSAEWVHLTVQHLAPAAEVRGPELATMIRLVQGRCRGVERLLAAPPGPQGPPPGPARHLPIHTDLLVFTSGAARP